MKSLFTTLFLFVALVVQSQSIQEIQGETDASPYVGEMVSTSGIVTASFADGYFIQDGTGMWSGIYVYDPSAPALGDEVTLTGEVEEFYNLTEIKNLTDFQILSSGNALPAAEVLNTGDVANEGWESVLVRVEEAECTNPDLGFGEFGLDDGTGQCRVDDLLFLYEASLGTNYNVEGPCYFSFGDYKIIPRDEADVENAEPLFFTVDPEEFNMTANSLTIEWETNVPANSVISYGLTSDLELGIVADENQSTSHALVLEDLLPATSYYIQVISEDGENETPFYSFIASTASEVTGEIKVWFNHSVDTSVAGDTEAVSTASITDTIITYMETAEHTLDIIMYDLLECDPALIAAINALHESGVAVRFISDLETENLILEDLNDEIPLIIGNEDGIMHDKFLIGDAEYPDLAWVMTGSMNWTNANLGWDYNNVMWIKDQALARTYTREFHEMWGSETMTPDEDAALFGPNKTNNTAHKFIINSIPVECYFSPTDGTTSQIRERIYAAEDDIAFGTMVFTENSLGQAMIDMHDAGVNVQGIIDYVEFNGSEFPILSDAGVNVMDYQNEDGSQWPDGPVFHHKYCLIDYMPGSENPVLVNGSHNWSASAESINDENTLIIYDADLVNQFYQEWKQRWDELTEEPKNIAEFDGSGLNVYPNPFQNQVQFSIETQGTCRVFDTQGRLVFIENLNAGNHILELGHLPSGQYTLVIEGTNTYEQKLIKR